MTCPSAFEVLSAFVDGELRADEELDVRRHLDVCAQCAAQVSGMERLKAAVSTTALDQPVPPELSRALRVERGGARPPWSRINWLAGVALMTAAAALVLWVNSSPEPDGFTTALVADHIHYAHRADRLQIAETNPRELRRWFARQLPFEPALPKTHDMRVLGGRLCTLRGNRLALAFGERNGTPVSIFVGQAETLTPDAKQAWQRAVVRPCRDSLDGYRVCFDRQGSLVTAVVERLDG